MGRSMTPFHYPASHQGKGKGVSRAFYETNEEFPAMVSVGSVNLTQLRDLTVDAREEFVWGLS